jgi:hypothetical protein
MARMLDVYLHGHLVVYLIQDDGGQERFAAKECRGFFGGILPEESKQSGCGHIRANDH